MAAGVVIESFHDQSLGGSSQLGECRTACSAALAHIVEVDTSRFAVASTTSPDRGRL
jgi:hypothetical protein